MTDFEIWKKLKMAIYQSRTPFKSEFDAWLNGFLEGMQTAAIIDDSHHGTRGNKGKQP